MRSGLDKPGALPLLGLIIFSLLTLVPSLSNIYNLKFADFPYYSGRTHRVPLIQDGTAELPPDTHLNDPRKSWNPAAPSRSRETRLFRTSRIGNGAPPISTESAPADNGSRVPQAATESSFIFGRRARAFRTYLSQRLDRYPFFVPLSNHNLSADTPDFNPDPTPPNHTPKTSIHDPDYDETRPKSQLESSTSSEDDLERSLSSLRSMWQQVCHSAIEFWSAAKESPYASTIQQALQFGNEYAQSILLPENTPTPSSSISDHVEENFTPSNNTSSTAAQTDKTRTLPNEQIPDAAGRHRPQLQGSCMAVVIGLVVGVMWF